MLAFNSWQSSWLSLQSAGITDMNHTTLVLMNSLQAQGPLFKSKSRKILRENIPTNQGTKDYKIYNHFSAYGKISQASLDNIYPDRLKIYLK